MANDAKITVEVVLKANEGLASGMASSIASELNKVLEKRENIARQMPEMEGIRNLPDQMAIIANTFKGMADQQDQSDQKLYAQFKQSEASYLVNNPDYKYETRGQKEARKMYEEGGLKAYKTFEDFSKAGQVASEQARMFSENVKLANREMRAGSQSISGNRMNYFNLTELLMAAAARASTGYFTAGASFQENALGTGGAALSQLRLSTDIAQRSAISTAIQTALPALGYAMGGLLGAGIGYAASLPVAIMSSARSAAQTQQLNLEQQSAISSLYGGLGASRTKTILPGSGIFGFDQLTANLNAASSSLLQGGQGPLIPILNSTSMAFNRYRRSSKIIDKDFLSTLGALAAQTGEDPSAIAQNLAFVVARTGMSPKDALTQAVNIGAQTGQTATDVLSMTASLSQSTALATPGNAQAFMSATAPFGPAYQQTAIGYQGAGFQQKITVNALASMFGLNAQGIMGGNAQSIAQFKHFVHQENKSGSIAGVGEGDILGQIITGGPSQFYSINNTPSAPAGSSASTNITSQQIQQGAPTAYQQAVQQASMQVQRANIIVKNFHGVGQRELSWLNSL